VCEENLRALLKAEFDPEDAWTQARASYTVVLNRLGSAPNALVLKLIVPLTPCARLELDPPADPELAAHVDPVTPPSLVIHAPVVARDWQPYEEYRRPYSTAAFVDSDAAPRAEAMYIVFRSHWEIADGSPYRRSLLFERVQEGRPGAPSP
jgi:hypothetical protein